MLAVLAVLAFAWPLSGQDRSEATVKAAYVFNLIRLIEWPPSAAPGVPDFTIAVLGRGPMLSALSADIGKPVKGRRLVVREISSIDELGSAQV
ncbi:MAG: YfiR family protein, partial [Acidobacteria bacterium]|nr:YfiR family protein [Acidobacteriota bacterium]